MHYPLYVIMSLLGLPESDFPRMLMLTQELFGGDDEELRRGETPEEQLAVLARTSSTTSPQLTASRRATPTDDLASAIANARSTASRCPTSTPASYYVDHRHRRPRHHQLHHRRRPARADRTPRELARLRDEPRPDADRRRGDDPLGHPGQGIHAHRHRGHHRSRCADRRRANRVYLAYASANRDEEIFDDPFRFDVGRDPNKHLAFGYGVHFCLGAALARMEVNSFFSELSPRLESIELTGDPQHVRHDLRRRTQASADPLLAQVN